jgi:uncharacterized protein (DUF433 family)
MDKLRQDPGFAFRVFVRRPGFSILDGLAQCMTEAEIMVHYPQLTKDDIRASLAHAADLAHESVWKAGTLE